MEDSDQGARSSGHSLSPAQQLQTKVTEWLTSQGYPLEMYTAKCCREAKFAAHQSWYYYDEESDRHRETDVFATSRRLDLKPGTFELDITFECKQSRAKPWVAFIQPGERPSMHPNAFNAQRFMPMHTMAWWRQLVQRGSYLSDYPLKETVPTAYALTRATLGSGSNEDIAYSGLMSVSKAAAGIAYWHNQVSAADPKFHSIIIPALVLDAPLFSCRLDDSNKLAVEPIDRCTLLWHNRISLELSPTTIVEIVTKQSLPDFLADMNQTLATIEFLASQPPSFKEFRNRRRSSRSQGS